MATVLGTVIALIGLVVALFAWLQPRSPAEDSPAGVSPTGGSIAGKPTAAGGSDTRTTAAAPPPAGSVFLDGGDFPPVAGADNVVATPRGITASHAIAITCPTNETSDQASDVTFLLRGRYYRFDATVRPYYPADADRKSVTYVTALIGTRQQDGSLSTVTAGSQKRASMTAPAALTATVEKAERLTLRVECQDPAGTILLTDARLSP